MLPTPVWLRVSAALSALLLLALHQWSRRKQPQLVLDDHGYSVEVAGVSRFSVPWSAVTRVLHDPSEQALYLDCGDPGRNLLLPPRAGFAFTFSQRDALYARLLQHIGDRAEIVARLDQPPPPPPPALTADR
ncbi:MAG: hypothetical protein JNJ46_11655 [Myxococcales bacterium]|nr:hypothetical protein [Myxococcales bacterium]